VAALPSDETIPSATAADRAPSRPAEEAAPSRREMHLARLAGGATALVLGWAALAAADHSPPSHVAISIAAAFVPYAALLRWRLAATSDRALAGLALVLAPPILSDDLYRYLWDARVLSSGRDPYALAPDDPALAPLRDVLHARVNHPDIPTIYPPLAQLVFASADAIAHSPWSIKLLALVAHLATTPIVAQLSGPRGAALAPLHALNPLAIEEAALHGHVDAFAALALALSVLALARSMPVRAALFLAMASGLKLVGLPLVPLMLPRARRAIPIVLGLSMLAIAPVALSGHGSERASGLHHYARRWRGNDGGFALLLGGSELALDAIGRASGAPRGFVRSALVARLVERGDRALRDPKKASATSSLVATEMLAQWIARALAIAIVLGVALRHARRDTEPIRAARDVLLALLLVAPQVHPWYLLWVLPLEIACGGSAALVWSAAILIAYAPLDGWIARREWVEWPSARLVEYAIVGVALTLDPRSHPRSRDDV
jgi:hypothetical protein